MKSRVLLLLFFAILSTTSYAQVNNCLFGNCRDGYGKFKYENGDVYIGHFDEYKSDGQGVLLYANGMKYIGSWKKGKIEGEGRMHLADGSVTLGIWKNNEYVKAGNYGCISGDCQTNYGIFLFENGTKYVGVFKEGKPSDQGTVFYNDGTKYVGEWVNQKRNGVGTHFTAQGLVKEGAWQNDKFIGETRAAKGCVEGDCRDGAGTYVYKDNTRYEGNFMNSVAHGEGICYYSDGDMYVGEWRNHNFDGFGTMYINDGTVLKGNWKDGEFKGEAKAEIQADAVSAKPKIYALLVGVARYNHMKSLRYTDDDAYRMYAFLKSPEGGALADDQIQVLIDEDATRERIIASMNDVFAKATENDMVFFYFSGHGLKGSFLPIDYDGQNNKLLHTDITKVLDKCKAKFKICIADACHSGSVEESLHKDGNTQSLIETYYDAFRTSAGGTALMMSSKAEETSIENNGLRQGIFSHFLIRGLKGGADHDNNNVVSVNELFEYVKANVRYYTNNYQTPVIYGEYDDNMPLGVVR
jgi:hypothetical protein